MVKKSDRKYGKTYLDLAIDEEIVKRLKHKLIDEFGSTRALSLLVGQYIKRGLAADDPDDIEIVREQWEARTSSVSQAMVEGRRKARA